MTYYELDMKRLAAKVPPPVYDDIERFKEQRGYENRSQAVRALIRQGLECER